MNILLCNDDGVYAEGIQALYDALKDIANVTVVAPLQERSTTGHTLTLDQPLRLEKVKDNFYGLSGFPADCALMGIAHVLKEKPDLVISGINRGANLGQDIYYSGTVAAAREAAFRGIAAISVSTDIDYFAHHKDNIHYKSAANFVRELVLMGIHKYMGKYDLININVPDLPEHEIVGHEITALGFRYYSEEIKERRDFKDRPYFWIGGVYKGHCQTDGSDCNAVDKGKISITPLNFSVNPTEEVGKLSDLIDKLLNSGSKGIENT